MNTLEQGKITLNAGDRQAAPDTKTPMQDIVYLERLHSLSQITASVVHEIRNPITTVKGFLQLFSGRKEFTNYKEHFEIIINELDRADLIIKEFFALHHGRPSALKPCQLNDIIHEMYPLLKAVANGIEKDIKLCLHEIPKLCLDEKAIRQLLLNMVRNGLEAMEGAKDRTTVHISTCLEENNVRMSIKDQGPGIAPHVLANLGQAFLTTKEHGTGLGLNVCYKIADSHNAKIEVDSSEQGTAFSVKFPLAEV